MTEFDNLGNTQRPNDNLIKMMKIQQISKSRKVFPTGNPSFSVQQAFPAAFSEKLVDPFLMCDYFGPLPSKGQAASEDSFPIPWHPHIGMDICTYLKQGIGRHGDSLGNRETFKTPGLQWISVGNGIEHAEGGGTPKGAIEEGFQLWFNTPKEFKSLPPKYGTVDAQSLPIVNLESMAGRYTVLAGTVASQKDGQTLTEGPFQTVQPIQVVDFELTASDAAEPQSQSSSSHVHAVPENLNTVVLFVYAGSGDINSTPVSPFTVLLLDASDPATRLVSLSPSAGTTLKVMLFAGKKIGEPIAWRGPFVMNTDEEIMKVMQDYRAGRFPPVRTEWDYKVFASKPK